MATSFYGRHGLTITGFGDNCLTLGGWMDGRRPENLMSPSMKAISVWIVSGFGGSDSGDMGHLVAGIGGNSITADSVVRVL